MHLKIYLKFSHYIYIHTNKQTNKYINKHIKHLQYVKFQVLTVASMKFRFVVGCTAV
jgi:hypothetical protein